MSNTIVNSKTYTGSDLEKIFFRPILAGDSAEELGIRILYNMPMPTVLPVVSTREDVMLPVDSKNYSWDTEQRTVEHREIQMERVKAENAYSASDYFSTIFESLSNKSGANLTDLSGTDLEAAETDLFRKAIAESIRMNLWMGDTSNTNPTSYNSFDGILTKLYAAVGNYDCHYSDTSLSQTLETKPITEVLDAYIEKSSPQLKGLFKEGQVAFFVSPGVYKRYQAYLDEQFGTAIYNDIQNGRKQLMFRGFPIVEVNLQPYINVANIPADYIVFTDRRNIVLAVNTADIPGAEIRMWYNPDVMQNRQRAVFAIGCEILDYNLVGAGMDYHEEEEE